MQWAARKESPHREVQRLQNRIQNFQLQHPILRDAEEEKQIFQEYNRAEERLDIYWKLRSRMQ
jgi:hypothetical protein